MAAYRHLDEVFGALAEPSRRLLLDSLNERNGQTLRELAVTGRGMGTALVASIPMMCSACAAYPAVDPQGDNP